MKKRFRKTNVAGHRPAGLRSANLNVRATPAQYLRWRRAADLAGLSLSAWVERWLDELAGGSPRVLDALFKFAPKYGGQMPLENLQAVLYRRWRWDEADVDRALERLAQAE